MFLHSVGSFSKIPAAIVAHFPVWWRDRRVQLLFTGVGGIVAGVLIGKAVHFIANRYFSDMPSKSVPSSPVPKPALTKPLTQETGFDVTSFCNRHKIQFRMELLTTIQDIQETNKTSPPNTDAKLGVLRDQISRVKNLVSNSLAHTEALTQIESDTKNSQKDAKTVYGSFQQQVEAIKQEEEQKVEEYRARLENIIQKETVAVFPNLQATLQYLILPERLEHYEKILPQRGIETLADLELLQLDSQEWRSELCSLKALTAALGVFPDNVSLKNALRATLTALIEKINQAGGKEPILRIENQRMEFKNEYVQSRDILLATLVDPALEAEVLRNITAHFEQFYRLQQCCLLSIYINQVEAHAFWTAAKNSNPQVTLSFIQQHNPNLHVYELGL